jgi:hypothetical protein
MFPQNMAKAQNLRPRGSADQAQEVQPVLIPEAVPQIPGFSIQYTQSPGEILASMNRA